MLPPTLCEEGPLKSAAWVYKQVVTCCLVKMSEDIDFSQPWTHSNIAFLIEEKIVYANKTILSMWSPVMHAMFTDDFKERNSDTIELPGKSYEDFLELMRVIHPPNKEIDGNNVAQLLPLTQEYQMTRVTERCEKYLLSQPPSIQSLRLAESYNLKNLMKTCVQYAKNTPLSQLQAQTQFENINPVTLVDILTHKVERLETPMNVIRHVTLHNKPNTSRWCPSTDSRDLQNRHDVGAKRGCVHCGAYNFEQIEKICAKLKF